MTNRQRAAAALAEMTGGPAARARVELRAAKIKLGHPVHDAVEITGDIMKEDCARIVRTIRDCKGASSLHIYVDSRGGDVITSNTIVDAIRSIAWRGMTITSHAGRVCASAAVPIFMMGDSRTCDSNTVFVLHRCSIPQAAIERMTADKLRKIADRLDGRDDDYLKFFEERLGQRLPANLRSEISRGADIDISTRLALSIGLVQGVA